MQKKGDEKNIVLQWEKGVLMCIKEKKLHEVLTTKFTDDKLLKVSLKMWYFVTLAGTNVLMAE